MRTRLPLVTITQEMAKALELYIENDAVEEKRISFIIRTALAEFLTRHGHPISEDQINPEWGGSKKKE